MMKKQRSRNALAALPGHRKWRLLSLARPAQHGIEKLQKLELAKDIEHKLPIIILNFK